MRVLDLEGAAASLGLELLVDLGRVGVGLALRAARDPSAAVAVLATVPNHGRDVVARLADRTLARPRPGRRLAPRRDLDAEPVSQRVDHADLQGSALGLFDPKDISQ